MILCCKLFGKVVINLEEKKHKRIGISLRFFVTAVIILVGAMVLLLYSIVSSKTYKNKYMSMLMDDLKFQSQIIAESIILNDYQIDGELNLGTDIDSVASFFDGRIIIVDAQYRIIKDTYISMEGSNIINSQVMKAMKQQSVISGEEAGFIQYIYPIVCEGVCHGAVIIIAPTDKIQSMTNQLSQRNVATCALILVACVIAAVFAGLASVRGINYINRQMEIVGEGHFDTHIPEKGFNEFKTMTGKYNATIDRLIRVDSTRQEFVSNVSHELKTPITSMKVLADSLVENEQADLAMYKEFMTDIVEEIDRETKIINDLLTLVRMDKKSTKPNIEEISINQLLEVILKRVTPLAETRGIEITYESYRDVVAEVDEVKLSLALTNIIENAVKYNIDNGWIKVTLNADHKNFYIKVADSGVGIPDDCKEQVFERFYRVDKARSRDTGGTGLGLAITKNVILMHKGTVKLYSESGEGTTFSIRIPLKYVEG